MGGGKFLCRTTSYFKNIHKTTARVRGVNVSRSNRGKRLFNYLRSSVVDRAYFRLSTVSQRLVIK